MDARFNVETLVGLVHEFYPTNLYFDDPGYVESPQFQRLINARATAERERAPVWRIFLQQLRTLLPGSFVWDLTYLRHDNCHRVRCYAPGAPKEDEKAVMACLSILAPVYVLYTAHERRENGLNLPATTFYEPVPETTEVEQVVDSSTREIFGFNRLSNDVLFTVVPDIQPGNRTLGEATLADCLFTDDRW